MEQVEKKRPFFKPWLEILLLVVFFSGALVVRLLDLTDLPNDFYMVRQYRSLLIARGMYYAHLPSAPEWQRDMAVAQWKGEGLIEPPIMERLAALTYHVIGEHTWVGKVYASFFWLAGGVGLWLLARELRMKGGGLIALAYFFFLPFGQTASQAFMPDSLMTALIIWSLWSLYHWEMSPGWRTSVMAGLFTGLAILVKSVAVFPLLGAAVGLILSRKNLKRMLADKQTWLVAGITALPTVVFYIYGLFIRGDLASQFSLRFMPALIKDPSFYVRWLFTATGVVGSSALLVSLAGILLFRSSLPRYMLIGGMFGYLVFGFFFPYHFITHEYYHLCLIPLVAIGIIPVAELLFDFLSVNRSRLAQPIVAGILLLGVGMQFWQARNYKRATDYRPEIAYWQALGEKIGHETKIIELTGDYGYRLAYFGWVDGAIWSSTADQELRTLAGQEPMDFASTFAEKTKGKELFVVTSPPEWEKQATLRAYLTDNYPLVEASDEGYWIFKLER